MLVLCDRFLLAFILRRSLPEPVLTISLLNQFEEATLKKDKEGIKNLLPQLPECNRDLLRWLFVHFKNVCANVSVIFNHQLVLLCIREISVRMISFSR